MIRKATVKDIETILGITKACANHMITNNIYQWNDEYPNRTVFEKDILRDELYVLQKDAEIIGCIALSTLMDKAYQSVSWLTPNTKHIYVHRLAVHPSHQSKGFAQQLMDYGEDFARKNSYSSIRLDTFSKNDRNQNFYELRGYQKLGAVYFPKQSKHSFFCYELVL
ncbi:GNAT family N-acetyltransferase [Psychroserpens sp. XS_ASV72]|uniref:GNAT family N-acetyltransferase n=1 Tax=Psychroserpens sp. XS_ASV72 TaxID=3241293 RepID=UPI00351956D7